MQIHTVSKPLLRLLLVVILTTPISCQQKQTQDDLTLTWYIFDEPSGSFLDAAERCSQLSGGRYNIRLTPLPTDADQQREQLVRRLAAADSDIDIIGMDVIWTAEFAEAGWILPWAKAKSAQISTGRLAPAVKSASYKNQFWAVPFTSNAQLLWYRNDRVSVAPRTWNDMITIAETIGKAGTLQLQGQRYEGLTVFFISLLASAGGSILNENGNAVSLEEAPTIAALSLMKRIASSPAADHALATAREDQARLAFETGVPSFMINYPFVWPSAHQNAPEIATHLAFANWPLIDNHPGQVVIGGLNLGIGAFTRHPELAYEAADCLASKPNQVQAAKQGGLPPTLEVLYDDPELRQQFPFADILRNTLRNAVLRPQSPLYNDISLAISRTLHPMRDIDPESDLSRLRKAVQQALNSEGLL